MKNIYLAGAVRTPIGKFGGTLQSLTAADMGVAVASETLRRANVSPDQIDDSIWVVRDRRAVVQTSPGRSHFVRAFPKPCRRLRSTRPAVQDSKRSSSQRRRSCWGAPTSCSPAAPKACHAFLTSLMARVGACGWATRNLSTACIATDSTILCQD